jgi:2-polyprenyl-6-hydroxyphenyl methylase/3-demethylubiquinone-9 3-methyltransferase
VDRRAALATLRRAYAAAPLTARLHAYGRFLSCPFAAVVGRLPPGARLLDVGAGHGTLSLLAAEHAGASVVALDPDRRKLFTTFRHPKVRFVAGYLEAVGGRFDAVALLDVLYRFPLAEWDGLLLALRARLRPGGLLLLKDLDPGHRWKARWNRTQERISDRLGLTLGHAFSYEDQEQVLARLARAGFAAGEAIDLGAGYPHAHVLYVARRG